MKTRPITMTPEQLEHTLAAGKGDHPRQRGRQWERFRRGYERIKWDKAPKAEPPPAKWYDEG